MKETTNTRDERNETRDELQDILQSQYMKGSEYIEIGPDILSNIIKAHTGFDLYGQDAKLPQRFQRDTRRLSP